jgi:hypothetical protein
MYGDGPIIYMAFADSAEEAFRYMDKQERSAEGISLSPHWSAKDVKAVPMRKGCFMRELA